jgi:hypothetical protein
MLLNLTVLDDQLRAPNGEWCAREAATENRNTGEQVNYAVQKSPAPVPNVSRYDMLCFEGIAMNLNVFLGNQSSPTYRLVPPPNGEVQTMIVHEPVSIQNAWQRVYLLNTDADIS